MLTLWVIVEHLRFCIQCTLKHWMQKRASIPHRQIAIRPIANRKHHLSQHKPEWLKHEIIRLKAQMPQAGCRTLSDMINRRYAASHRISIGKTCVHRIIQRHQYEIQILRRKHKHATPKPVARNLIWGLDLTGKTDTHGKLHALLGIIDHGSRSLLHLQALHDKTTHTLIASISEVIRLHGKPKVIRTDCGRVAAQQRGTHRRTPCGCNEGMFRSPAFANALKQLGIRHQRTDPGCPWQNGRIERLFGTLKEKLDQRIYSPLPAGEGQGVREQLNRDLDTFRHWYNQVRPHQNLDGRTPAEAWCGINPYLKPPKQEQWFEAWDGLLTGYQLRY
ncbi:MAG: transposase family protein [Sideroxydans sp.]|nr:transposase family protein [Sideroxydans sp.]